LQDDISFFDLLKGSSPALSTYPEELIPVADDGVTPTKFYGGVVGRVGAGFTESRSDQELIEVKNKLRCVMEAEALWESEFNS